MVSQLNSETDNLLNLDELCNEKPVGWSWKVDTYYNSILANQQLLVYPCSPSKMFVPPDSLDLTIVNKKRTELKNLYALSRGPDDNSLVLLKYKSVSDNYMSFMITKFIENVYMEFLWEIQIPQEFEELCREP